MSNNRYNEITFSKAFCEFIFLHTLSIRVSHLRALATYYTKNLLERDISQSSVVLSNMHSTVLRRC